ncbi:glycosyl hydrolase family 28-related protein [Kiritimatiella glycovorans]|nr:glycosyl hydrolase family 28-related protein [Kiritimatiella glycovorans]
MSAYAAAGALEPFSMADPLGINVEDVAALNELGNQPLARLGYVDVTAAPFHVDGSGETDVTVSLQEAITFARHHKMAAYLPAGTYRVSDTIRCFGGWRDYRDEQYRYLPHVDFWPCVVVGDTRGAGRPRIVLAANSPDFNNPAFLKPVVQFFARSWRRDASEEIPRLDGSPAFNQLFKGVDIEIEPGNPRATALFMDSAEGATIQDCTLDAGEGYACLERCPGSGGAVFNVEMRGGRVGAVMNGARPSATLAGVRFRGQREAAIHYDQRGGLTVVGCTFDLAPGVPAVRSRDTRHGALSVVDTRIAFSQADPGNVAFDAGTAFYLRDVYVHQAAAVLKTEGGRVLGSPEHEWVRVDEAAVGHDSYPIPIDTPIYIDGEERGAFCRMEPCAEPEDGFVRRHIFWDESTAPAFDRAGYVNVKDAPYHARGDGETDDTEALQRAIDEHEVVFLPKGAYRITRTLRLRPETKLFGVSPSYSLIVPMEVSGGDFMDPADPRPAIRTADRKDADTVLEFVGIYLPRELVHAVYALDWRCGGRSRLRCAHPLFGYTELDWEFKRQDLYPWDNWSWEDMGAMATMLEPDGVRHRSIPGFAPDTSRDRRRNWPMQLVRGHGGGAWYAMWANSTWGQGARYRQLRVEGIDGPFAIYHAQLQYSRGEAEIEMVGARNVSIYGTKKEMDAPVLVLRDCENVLYTGNGGPGMSVVPEWGHYRIFNSRAITLANLFFDPRPEGAHGRSESVPIVRVYDGQGRETFWSEPGARPVLFKRTP